MRLTIIFILLVFNVVIYCQGISINSNLLPPHHSAILDISDTTKGVYLPRLTTQQRNSIGGPQQGLMIYNIELNKFEYFDGNSWNALSSSSALTAGNGIQIQNDTISIISIPSYGLPSGGKINLYSVTNSPPGGSYDLDTIFLHPGNILTIEVSGMYSGGGRGRIQLQQNGVPLTGIYHAFNFNEYKQSCGDSEIRYCSGTSFSVSSDLPLSYSGCGGCPIAGLGFNRKFSVDVMNNTPIVIQYNSYSSALNFDLKVSIE